MSKEMAPWYVSSRGSPKIIFFMLSVVTNSFFIAFSSSIAFNTLSTSFSLINSKSSMNSLGLLI